MPISPIRFRDRARCAWRPSVLTIAAALALAPAASATMAGDGDGAYTGAPPGGTSAGVSGQAGIDHVAPVIQAGIRTRRLRTLARRGTLKVSAGVNERGGVAMVAAIQPLRGRRGHRKAGTIFITPLAVHFYAGPGTTTFVLRLTARARRALRKADAARLVVTIAADDAVRNRSRVVLRKTLG
jgi:hypothetical protein